MTAINPRVFQTLALASALELYAKAKIQVNRAYTPSAMIQTAKNLTGLPFKARDYTGTAFALRRIANATSDEVIISFDSKGNVLTH